MRRFRPWLILLLALSCGAAAGFMALQYLRQNTPTLAAETRTGEIAVAVKELPVGSVIQPGDVKLIQWPGGVMPRRASDGARAGPASKPPWAAAS